MAKASDILNKSGTGGFSPMTPPKPTIAIGESAKKDAKGETESAAAKRPDLGHNIKGGRAQGGGGQSSARPKV
jgi:hypothetical protein